MKVGIAIDPWKLSIFERHLSQSGYKFTNAGHLHKDALLLHVITENVEALGIVVGAANSEAKQTGKPA